MRILITPDSFKGSVSAPDAASAIAAGVRLALPDAALTEIPVADGGEGTLSILCRQEDRVSVSVTGPSGQPVSASVGFTPGGAVIEMAQAAGLGQRLPGSDVLDATTYGVGELIRFASDRGAAQILLTVGGSGTNDGGLGMLCALGSRIYDAEGRELPPVASSLLTLAQIDLSGIPDAIRSISFTVASDVKNPLCGPEGATAVFGPQKGVSPELVPVLDAALGRYAQLLASCGGTDPKEIPGCGAGGGIATPLLSLFGAKVTPGIEAVLSLADFDTKLRDADLVITGEGKFDRQSLYGKVIAGVARHARAAHVPVAVLAGCADDVPEASGMGICRIRTLVGPTTVSEAAIRFARPLLSVRAAELIQDLIREGNLRDPKHDITEEISMSQSYEVKRIRKGEKPDFENAPVAPIRHFKWVDGVRPDAFGQVIYEEGAGFHVRLGCYEQDPVAKHIGKGVPVCLDSALEFFADFAGDGKNYLNIEMNSIGSVIAQFGPDRYTRADVSEAFSVEAKKEAGFWSVETFVPLAYVWEHFGVTEAMLADRYAFKANFYKCGDDTPSPHYGMWNPVGTEIPDFHRPEYFADLIIDAR